MTYSLLIGDRSYSSWSLRGWLLFAKFDIPHNLTVTRMYHDRFAEDLKPFAPACTVPCVRTAHGVWSDSLAIAEGLAEAHPERAFWPKDPAARCLARSMVSEMHSGYSALRGTFPMNLRHAFAGVPVPADVACDLARIGALWARAQQDCNGPWLFGAYSIADAFFAPVACRIATYGLPVDPQAQAYVARTIADPVFVRWRRAGLKDAPQASYDMAYPQRPWPGPA